MELRVPQDRAGRFSTELFERYQRSEKALVGTLWRRCMCRVSRPGRLRPSPRLFAATAFQRVRSAPSTSRLDESLKAFSERRLSDAYPYLILDARCERIGEGGVITNQAVLIAVAVDWEGRRQILAVELANRESRSSWRDFLLAFANAGLLVSSLWSRTIMPGLKPRSAKCCRLRSPHRSTASAGRPCRPVSLTRRRRKSVPPNGASRDAHPATQTSPSARYQSHAWRKDRICWSGRCVRRIRRAPAAAAFLWNQPLNVKVYQNPKSIASRKDKILTPLQ